jgi:hypothetical protein
MKKWLLGILAGGIVLLLAWLFLPRLPFFKRPPVARIYVEPRGGMAPLTVNLASVGANPKNEELQLEWTVDGAVVSSKNYFYHKLETPGQHTVTLKVTDHRGAFSTDSVTIKIAQRTPPPLAWSMAGPIEGMQCVQVNEPADPAPWADNYLCSVEDFGIRWSSAGPIAGMRCTQITEPAEPVGHGWDDNYLCVPESSPLELEWSNTGRIAKKKCIAIREIKDRDGWRKTALCYSLNSTDEAQKPAS